MNRHLHHRSGSALVLVIGMIVVMAAMATTFISLMGERRGLAELVAGRQRLQIFTEEVHDEVSGLLLAEIEDPATSFTAFSHSWYRDHMAVDGAGNPRWIKQNSTVGDPSINVNWQLQLWNHYSHWQTMLGGWYNGINSVERYPIEQYHHSLNRSGLNRWRYLRFLDDDFNPVETGDPEQDRASARFALRYAAAIFDNNGMLRIRPDLPYATAVRSDSDSDYLDFLRLQNHRIHFARSLKSMLGTHPGAVQLRPRDPLAQPAWAWDREYVGFDNEGERIWDGADWGPSVLPIHHSRDWRINFANFFAGVPFKAGDGGAYQLLPNGPYTPRHFDMTYGEADLGHFDGPHDDAFWQVLIGRARGLRDDALGGSDPCTTPWAINVLTASKRVLGMAVLGLTDRWKLGANASLLGRDYPEPFPLEYEGGRYIRQIGNGDAYGRTWLYQIFLLYEGTFTSGDINVRSQRLGYWADLIAAINGAIAEIREVHNLGVSLSNGVSLIDETATDRAVILHDLVAEILRILGEPEIRVVGGLPTSVDGILSGGVQPVGIGAKVMNTSSWWGRVEADFDPASGQAPQEKGFLAPGANSRAIEYLLNDSLISLFGTANPDYDPENATDLRGIAVDFNGDGAAESTVTGWRNGSRTTWSWWWNGLGPDEGLDPDLADSAVDHSVPAWMQEGAWYRFDPMGPITISRWNGATWEDVGSLPGAGMFLAINQLMLFEQGDWPSGNHMPGDAASSPIRPVAHSGRLFVGLSSAFTCFISSELVDLKDMHPIVSESWESTWHRDPNGDGDCSDSYWDHRHPFNPSNVWESY